MVKRQCTEREKKKTNFKEYLVNNKAGLSRHT